MATRTRGHKLKRDVAQSGILNRLPTSSLGIRENQDVLFYQLLHDLEFSELPAVKQPIAILYALTFCQIADRLDCRDVHSDADVNCKVAAQRDLSELYMTLYRLFDKLNSGQSRKTEPSTETEPTTEDPLDAIQNLLSARMNDNTNG